jgi:hypothetical protein
MWYLHSSNNTRGQVLPLVAICLAVLMGFAGMAIDVGFAEYQQRQQQNATDAAAIGGAQQMIYSGCGTGATAAADNDATNNGYTNGSNGVTVTVSNPPSSGPYASNDCAVQVQITNSNARTFFTKLFGKPSLQESTSAVAAVEANNNGCIYLLSPTVASSFSGDILNAQCGILINDTASFSGSTITAKGIGYAGGAPSVMGTIFTEASPSPMLAVADPCSEIPGCAYLAANPPSPTNCTPFSASGVNENVSAGCYSSFQVSGSNLNLGSGLYVFTGPVQFSGSNVTGAGVTFYATVGSTPDFSGVNLSLTPPTSGNYANVLYYQVPSNTSNPSFSGTNNNLRGLIYAPGAINTSFSGSAGAYTVLVFGSLAQSGSVSNSFGAPPANASLIKNVVLVQ